MIKQLLFCLILITSTPCLAQEIEGPEYIPNYVFQEPQLPVTVYNFSEDVQSTHHRDILEYNPILSSESLTEVLRRHSRVMEGLQGCLALPFPIDDYYVGCYFQFDPHTEDHRVDVWDEYEIRNDR